MADRANDTVVRRIIAEIQVDEGGVKDVGDHMGITSYGQTDGWLTTYGLPRPTSSEMAAQNWRDFLRMTQLDQLTGVHEALAHAVIDWAVMSGVGPAVRALQGALAVKQDGLIGDETLTAALHADPIRVAHVVLERRRAAYVEDVVSDPTTNLQFLRGWNARVARELAEVHGITL